MSIRHPLLSSLLALGLVSLTACGGSSSTTLPPDGDGGQTPPTVNVVPATGTLQASAPAPTYAAASLHADTFFALQAVRIGAGAGAVRQSQQLDVAAQAHADYLTVGPLGHYENSSYTQVYYAYSPSDRMTKAGFSASFTTEIIGGTGASKKGADCVLGLLNTVYHAVAILGQLTHVGIGYAPDDAGIPGCVIDFAAVSNEPYGQVAPAGEVVVYPHSGQANVYSSTDLTYESPRPPRSVVPDGVVGTPIVASVRNADFVNYKAAGTLAVAVSKFELKDPGGNLVPAGILANAGISGASLTSDAQLADGALVLVPRTALVSGATYTASFSATLKAGGTPLTKTWSFTTAQ